MASPNLGFGERLRTEREANGVTLEQIAARTHVSVRMLRSIETEKFNELPGGLFSTSFVRQYARHAGLDEDAIVAEFKRLTQPAEAVVATEALPQNLGASLVESIIERARRYQVTPPIIMTLVLTLVAGAVIFAQWDWNSGFSAISETILSEYDGSDQPSSTPAASAPATSTGAAPYADPKPVKAVHVELSMTDTVWIRAVADGQRIFQRTFRPGDSESVEADQNVLLLVGNAGGLAVSLNGDGMPPVGLSGLVRRVLFTEHGMEILQSPKEDGGSDSQRPPQVQASNLPLDQRPALARRVTPSN
ncbi:MAG: DUF4115 domain-containing protein [Acidobacteria bacterium]|nr:DUF4115 domain-containing protein [Acidobacteriota bacterium]